MHKCLNKIILEIKISIRVFFSFRCKKEVVFVKVSNRAMFFLVLLISLIMLSSSVLGTQITTDSNYERNPSILKDSNADYWLFYTSSDSISVRSGGDVDSEGYTIWYKKASSIEGLESASSKQIPGIRPAGFAQRDVAAYEYDNKIIVITSSGYAGGSWNDDTVYFYVYDGANWMNQT
jgi:hypothetical protein